MVNREHHSSLPDSHHLRPSSTRITDEERLFRDLVLHVYDSLRQVMTRLFIQEPHSYQIATHCLLKQVHERAMGHPCMAFCHRNQFFWFAGSLLRHLLLETIKNPGLVRNEQVPATNKTLSWGLISHGDKLALTRLPHFHRVLSKLELTRPSLGQIVVMRIFAGMEFRHIAEVMTLPEKTVRRQWARARRRFADDLSNQSSRFQA